MLPADHDPFLATVTKTIVDRFAPERVVLFGSRARGDHEPESDYDLIVVLETPLSRGERSRPIREALGWGPRGIDVIVYTPAEFDRSRHDVGAMAYAGEIEGHVLYDRTPSRWPRLVREVPPGTPDSLAAWLERAESDFAMMEANSASTRSLDGISFHAHQATEKFLKAAMIRSHHQPPRTHLLSELLAESVAGLRDNPELSSACQVLDVLWPKMRYPDQGMPTLEEAEDAIAAARKARTLIMLHLAST